MRRFTLALLSCLCLAASGCEGGTIHGLDEEAWLELLASGEPLPIKPGERLDFRALARLGPGASLLIGMRALEAGETDMAIAALEDSLRRDEGRFRRRAAELLGDTLLEAGDGRALLRLCRSDAGAELGAPRRAYLELRALALEGDDKGTLAALEAYEATYPPEAVRSAPELAALAVEAGLRSGNLAWAEAFAGLVAMESSASVHAALARAVRALEAYASRDQGAAAEAIGALPPGTRLLAEARALSGAREYGPAALAFRRYAAAIDATATPDASAAASAPPAPEAPLTPEAAAGLFLGLDRGPAADAARAFMAVARDEGAAGLEAAVLALSRRAAGNPSEREKEYVIRFWHGRFSRDAESWGEAEAAFAAAAGLADSAADRDAARWYAVEAAWKRGDTGIVDTLGRAMAASTNPGYYSDLLEPISREALARRDGASLARLDALLPSNTPAKDAARLAYLCARAAQEGIIGASDLASAFGRDLSPADYIDSRLRLANGQKADPWYRCLAAYRLGLPLVEPFVEPFVEPLAEATAEPLADEAGEKAPKPETAPAEAATELAAYAEALSRFGLGHRLRQELGADFMGLEPATVRGAAERLSAAGRPDQAYRLIATQFWKAAFEPTRTDAELYWPRPFLGLFSEAALANDLDLHLLYGLARSESAFDKDAVSRSGAKGLIQLMPATAEETAGRLKMTGYDLFVPADNLAMGAYYLGRLLRGSVAGGRVLAAVCSYNAGASRFRGWESAAGALPLDLLLETLGYAETRQYGRNVLLAALNYAELYGDVDERAYLAYLLGEGPRP